MMEDFTGRSVRNSKVVFVIILSLSAAVKIQYHSIKTLDSRPSDFFDADVTDHVTDLAQYGMDKTAAVLVFEVKACVQAKVFMTNSEVMAASTLRYEILMGGWANTKSAIRRTDSNFTILSIKFDNVGILDCNAYRQFWASWENGYIRLGTGVIVGQNLECSWTDPEPFVVRSVGIYTRYNDGEWRVQIDVADAYTGYYSTCHSNHTKANLVNLGTGVMSEIQCIAVCGKMNDCVGINYNYEMNRCEWLSFGVDFLTDIPQYYAAGWNYYTKCLRGAEVCVGCFFKQ
ncbi:unnamed protein product [Mytilus edulis]|uniref:Farnesoic acid O-methyl transferase domain-containing protein n=1 Tax=Mytilus edulis TaxID=6550 RepID=A0A8S3S107_MYTED|nr:unnamed protein product [Mytilus edulis]